MTTQPVRPAGYAEKCNIWQSTGLQSGVPLYAAGGFVIATLTSEVVDVRALAADINAARAAFANAISAEIMLPPTGRYTNVFASRDDLLEQNITMTRASSSDLRACAERALGHFWTGSRTAVQHILELDMPGLA